MKLVFPAIFEGSIVFTLNNSLDKPDGRDADRALLDALYSPTIQVGDPVGAVLRHIEQNLLEE